MRRTRERELVLATRALFDERGMQHAPIEEIAQAVGIARGLVYRHFTSKEELHVLTVTTYLDELAELLEEAAAGAADPIQALRRVAEAYSAYCQRFPAFLDCSMSLMQRPARELREIVSDAIYLRLGQGMARCLDVLAGVLRRGVETGVFVVEDCDYTANVLWTQVLGVMHLARLRVGVRQDAPGVPALFRVDADRLVQTCVDMAMAAVAAGRRG